MNQRVRIVWGLLVACALLWPASGAFAQGVTTGAINGIVKDAQGLAVPGQLAVVGFGDLNFAADLEPLIRREPPARDLMRELKAAIDPYGTMNPAEMVC